MISNLFTPETFPYHKNSIVTMGAFDGLHLGHQFIIQELIRQSKSTGSESVLITFDPHPQEIISKGPSKFFLLTTLKEKATLLHHWGVDKILVIPFSRAFSELSAPEFIERFLVKTVGLTHLMIGYDHAFGHNREGTFDLLTEQGKELGFTTEQIAPQSFNDVVISSTKIRNALHDGLVKTAQTWLGRNYSINGLVLRGDGIGSKIGFPTANIFLDHPKKLIPKDGVYIVTILIDNQWYKGVANIGFRPTFNGVEKRIEVHIFNFGKDIYGNPVQVVFHDRLRDEMKFASKDLLVEQIGIDVLLAKEWFSKSGLLEK